MKRTILLLSVLAFFVACGGDSPDAVIANTQARTPRYTLGLSAAQIETLLEDDVDDVFGSEAGDCGDILEISGYRTDSEVVFRFEVAYDFCFATDLHQVVLLDVTWRGDPGTIVFYNFQSPDLVPGGAAYFRPAGAGKQFDEVIPEINVTQWMSDPPENYFYLSVPIRWFSFKSEEDTFSTFRVAAQVDRGAVRDVADFTDIVNVDFNDLP